MEALLDFSRPFDVRLLEQVLKAFLDASNPAEHQRAHAVVVSLKENPQSWRYVRQILEETTDEQTKIFALQLLEQTVKFRWKSLPSDEQLGVRTYVTTQIITLSSDRNIEASRKLFLKRMNLVLVEILKQEWPHNWPSFIPEIVGSAKTSESLCQNNMLILQLLSEEVFDFSKDDMTAAKTKAMKLALNDQFKMVFELCQLVLERATDIPLVTTTLQTLLRFLNWIPVGYIFETNLIDGLVNKFFPVRIFHNDALACLTEIGSLKEDTEPYENKLVLLHNGVVHKLVTGVLPADVNFAAIYRHTKQSEDRVFVQQLALFFSSFYSTHLHLLERDPANHEALLIGLKYLFDISKVDNPEIFKICLDFWTKLAQDLYQTECASNVIVPHAGVGNRGGFQYHFGGDNNGQMNDDDDDNDPDNAVSIIRSSRIQPRQDAPPSLRMQLYAQLLSQLRSLAISRMAKPEEVLVKMDETGDVVREVTKDTDAIALYMQMRDTLVYLTHLDVDDTEAIMMQELAIHCDNKNSTDFDPRGINTLSWAIGSISGTMSEATEKQFLVAVIKDLLVLCEMKSGKDTKALIASDIMYVVGQYPRFLRNHWKFLKTVVHKLIEFMHELHPGVQDMACDTFLKLAHRCKRKFVLTQEKDDRPFIEYLLSDLPNISSDLQPHHIHSLYQALGVILACHTDQQQRARWLEMLMDAPNRQWTMIMNDAKQNLETLVQEQRIKDIQKIIRTNNHVAKTTGHTFITQLAGIHHDMLQLYKVYATHISDTVRIQGPHVTRHSQITAMRAVKVETLSLLQTFIERSEDPQMVATQVVETLYIPVLEDYASSVPEARDAAVLELFAAIVRKLKGYMASGVHRILQATFAPTLSMICTNFEDFPDHRAQFYSLLKEINEHCFVALWGTSADAQKQIVDAVIWGIKHKQTDVAQTGLEILERLLKNVGDNPGIAQQFYHAYLLRITSEILYCLTDRLHKSGFSNHATLLKLIFGLVKTGQVQVSLFETSGTALIPVSALDNINRLTETVSAMTKNAFPNVSQQVIQQFVQGLFQHSGEDLSTYKQHVRDFLVESKEFSAEDNKDLYRDEAEATRRAILEQRMAVPGLVNPNDDFDEL